MLNAYTRVEFERNDELSEAPTFFDNAVCNTTSTRAGGSRYLVTLLREQPTSYGICIMTVLRAMVRAAEGTVSHPARQ